MRFVHTLGLCVLLGLLLVPSAAAFRFSDASRNPPTGVVGQAYFHKLGFMAGCKGVKLMVDSGSLPPGLKLGGEPLEDKESEEHNWRIEGVPTTPGSFSFWLRATNLCPGDSTEEPFTINIGQGLTIDTPTLPGGTIGAQYGIKLAASGGGNLTWSVAKGALPAGLALAGDGTLSGNPTTEGEFGFGVKVDDGGGRFSVRDFTLRVVAPLSITAPTPPPAEVGRPFALTLTAAGGYATRTWETPQGLPSGILFDPGTGSFRGAPENAGTFPINITVKDGEGRTTSTQFSIQISPKLVFTTQALRRAKVGSPYSARFSKQGGVGTVTWRLIRVRPASAIAFDRATGILTWTPRAARPVNLTIRLQDQLGAIATQSFVLEVTPRKVVKRAKRSSSR